ncbi:hypothetical protein AWB67_07420 [Caballeronia terrestris]|uniref:Uncharacterized protein n=1 Tax=Caballeronia terrestris TaxID=1226301 RepID=A0A158L2A4_9BURK|nr:hypothetical protein AWB67_07420 [Caballeronia terrestris]
MLGNFERKRFGEAVDARFGRRIIRLAERAARAVHRANIDDTPETTLDHSGNNRLGHIEERVQIRAQDGIPIRLCHVDEPRIASDSRIVDKHIDNADIVEHALSAFGTGVEVRDIDHLCVKLTAIIALLREPRCNVIIALRMCHYHCHPSVMQPPADRRAKAARPACHQGDAPRRHDGLLSRPVRER